MDDRHILDRLEYLGREIGMLGGAGRQATRMPDGDLRIGRVTASASPVSVVAYDQTGAADAPHNFTVKCYDVVLLDVTGASWTAAGTTNGLQWSASTVRAATPNATYFVGDLVLLRQINGRWWINGEPGCTPTFNPNSQYYKFAIPARTPTPAGCNGCDSTDGVIVGLAPGGPCLWGNCTLFKDQSCTNLTGMQQNVVSELVAMVSIMKLTITMNGTQRGVWTCPTSSWSTVAPNTMTFSSSDNTNCLWSTADITVYPTDSSICGAYYYNEPMVKTCCCPVNALPQKLYITFSAGTSCPWYAGKTFRLDSPDVGDIHGAATWSYIAPTSTTQCGSTSKISIVLTCLGQNVSLKCLGWEMFATGLPACAIIPFQVSCDPLVLISACGMPYISPCPDCLPPTEFDFTITE